MWRRCDLQEWERAGCPRQGADSPLSLDKARKALMLFGRGKLSEDALRLLDHALSAFDAGMGMPGFINREITDRGGELGLHADAAWTADVDAGEGAGEDVEAVMNTLIDEILSAGLWPWPTTDEELRDDPRA